MKWSLKLLEYKNGEKEMSTFLLKVFKEVGDGAGKCFVYEYLLKFNPDFYELNKGKIVSGFKKTGLNLDEENKISKKANEIISFIRYPYLSEALIYAYKNLGVGCDRIFMHGEEIASSDED